MNSSLALRRLSLLLSLFTLAGTAACRTGEPNQYPQTVVSGDVEYFVSCGWEDLDEDRLGHRVPIEVIDGGPFPVRAWTLTRIPQEEALAVEGQCPGAVGEPRWGVAFEVSI